MKRFFVKASIGAAGLVALLVALQGGTNLDETPLSLISTSKFFTNEGEGLAALAGVDAQLRTTTPEGGLYDGNEITTDEMVVPIVTTTELGKHPRNTRREVFDFIEKELIAARDSGLPATRPVEENGRLTKGAADAILANMYVNAGVFTKDGAGSGGINATGYNSCSGITVTGGDACQAAIAASDRLLNSGHYRLADSFPQNFRADNNHSAENILVL